MEIQWFWGLRERHREELLELESVKATGLEGTATSQHEGKLDVSLNLRRDSGRYAGELVTPVGTYTVKDGHFEANQLHLNLDSGGDSVIISPLRSLLIQH
jgi:hypothetical protein